MNRIMKILGFGFLVWLIPFILAMFFYTPEGELALDVFLFKSIMIVFSSAIGAALLVNLFKGINKAYIREGTIMGITWFVINIVLDLIVLLPLSGMDMGSYFAEIGLRYLIMPIMSIAMGFVAGKK